jgi:hypothetical protein
MSYLLKKDHRFALEVAGPLADRNPDWTDAQILVAQILGEMTGEDAEAAKRVNSIRSAYKLTPTQEAALAAVEAEAQRRKSP